MASKDRQANSTDKTLLAYSSVSFQNLSWKWSKDMPSNKHNFNCYEQDVTVFIHVVQRWWSFEEGLWCCAEPDPTFPVNHRTWPRLTLIIIIITINTPTNSRYLPYINPRSSNKSIIILLVFCRIAPVQAISPIAMLPISQ